MLWQVDERLFVSGQPRESELATARPTAIVTVCPRPPDPRLIVGREHRHLPLSDGRTLQLDRYREARDVVLRLHRDGHTVLVHCMAGRNRSALIAALALRRLRGATSAELLAGFRELRPNCFHNETQLTWLLSLDADG